MASSEWMELESLSREITDSQGRLEAAKSVESFELAAVLEREIAEMEDRRGKLLAHIANSVVGEETAVKATEKPHAKDEQAQPEHQDAASQGAETEPPDEETVSAEPDVSEPVSASVPPSVAAPDFGARNKDPGAAEAQTRGDGPVWNQLTPADVQRAKQELLRRRVEMLTRHAEELKSLEADAEEIDALEQAINVFLQKFTSPVAGAEVVPLEFGRSPRVQAAD